MYTIEHALWDEFGMKVRNVLVNLGSMFAWLVLSGFYRSGTLHGRLFWMPLAFFIATWAASCVLILADDRRRWGGKKPRGFGVILHEDEKD